MPGNRELNIVLYLYQEHLPNGIEMKNTLNALFVRAKYIWRNEGFIPLLRRGLTFLAEHTFQYDTFYLSELNIEHDMKERKEADYLPKTRDFTLYIVHTNREADALAAKGFEFRSYSYQARRNLDKGAVAFCVSVGQELAHIGWVALTQEAMNAFEPYPYHVDFLNGEACLGGSLTIPKYRRKGFQNYVGFKRRQFLWKEGIKVARGTLARDNIASHRVINKFNTKVYTKARYLKILWWKFWKETPLMPTNNHD